MQEKCWKNYYTVLHDMKTGPRLRGAEMSSQIPACLQETEMPILAI